jgi:hypothetical protein
MRLDSCGGAYAVAIRKSGTNSAEASYERQNGPKTRDFGRDGSRGVGDHPHAATAYRDRTAAACYVTELLPWIYFDTKLCGFMMADVLNE